MTVINHRLLYLRVQQASLQVAARRFMSNDEFLKKGAMGSSSSWIWVFLALFALSSVGNGDSPGPGLVMDFYKESCPQAEDIIREQVKLLYKRHKNTAFSWLRNIFHDCAVQSCDASLLLETTRKTISEKETDRSFGMRNFRYLEDIKDAVERECPGVVSCADILVLSARDGIVAIEGHTYL
ncbi:hypothetical protein HPP92_011141 [Vanilla planifolia]|uniref:Plant heme peroxidase family profile domain-containing protein n=1 Tax=Vanilla planifolia TaxID=51239 RepID=A0A835QYH0_VANPL|nr:hypothetical protein HPP92_011141 [Vanilla planifolia]